MESTTHSQPKVRMVYPAGVGQDPAVWQANADAYGWEIVWPEKQVRDWYDPVGSLMYSVLALVWFAPAFFWAFPRRKWVAFACVAAGGLMLAVVSQAGTITASGLTAAGGASIPTMSVTWSLSGSSLTLSATLDSELSSGNNNFHSIAYVVSTEVPSGEWTQYDNSTGAGQTGSNPVNTTGKTNIQVGLVVYDWTNSVIFSDLQAADADPTYEITFTIPANSTQLDQTYQFLVNGEVVDQFIQSAGAGQTTHTLTGLDSDDDVTMVRIDVVNEWIEDPLNPGHYIPGSTTVTGVTPVSSGTPTTGGTTVPAPTDAQVPSGGTVPTPVPPTPTPAPDVSAPTPAPNVTGPTPFSNPFGGTETTDTSGAKTQDIANAANAIVEGLSDLNIQATTNANGIIDAVNTGTAAATVNANGIIEAVNTGSAAVVGGLASVVTALNALKAQGIANANAENSVGGATAPAGLTDPTGQTAIWDPSATNVETMLIGKLPTAPTIQTTVSPQTTISIAFEYIIQGTTVTVDEEIDFSAAPFAGPIAVFRGILNLFVTLGFFILTFYTVRGAFTTAK